MRTNKDLKVWKDSILLAKDIYEPTDTCPAQQRFGIVQQMRRAAQSTASNISEGTALRGGEEFLRFLYIAAGSASGLSIQLEISKLIGFGDVDRTRLAQQRVDHIGRMLRALVQALKLRSRKSATRFTNHKSLITNH
jgi:four helix bundle protein